MEEAEESEAAVMEAAEDSEAAGESEAVIWVVDSAVATWAADLVADMSVAAP